MKKLVLLLVLSGALTACGPGVDSGISEILDTEPMGVIKVTFTTVNCNYSKRVFIDGELLETFDFQGQPDEVFEFEYPLGMHDITFNRSSECQSPSWLDYTQTLELTADGLEVSL